MSLRYPNANYPQSYDEDDFQVTGDIPVNTEALNLTVTTAGVGQGPLKVTGEEGATSPSGDGGSSEPAPAPDPDPEPESDGGDSDESPAEDDQ